MARPACAGKSGGCRWHFPVFFVLLLISTLGRAAEPRPSPQQLTQQQGLASSPAWLALLHTDGENSHIEDPRFLLSLPRFSAEEELRRTIDLLLSRAPPDAATRAAICRFPARYHWLAIQLGVTDAIDVVAECPDIKEFFERSPAQQVSLVYASENLASASSLMGHVLLKLSGVDPGGTLREHAISYFTDIRGFNVPKILFDSLVTGKPGYYTLSPYREKTDFYLGRERRNVWEYRLKLNPQQRHLLLLHLVELRSVQLRYFFDSHNCATLTADLIGLVEPAVRKPQPFWTSPLDVVKEVRQAGIVENVSVVASSNWQIRMLEESLPPESVRAVRGAVMRDASYQPAQEMTVSTAYLGLQLANAYADQRQEQGHLSAETHRQIVLAQDAVLADRYRDLQIDLSQYKSPERGPQDSQVRAGLVWQDGRTALQLGILPAAHRLEDDNRQQFGESELRLADLSLRVEPDDGNLELDDFQLYSMTSLIPFNAVSGGLSGRFRLGVERQRDSSLRSKLVANVAGGIGVAASPNRSVLLYGLAGAGVAAGEAVGYGYLEPELGMILRPMAPTKTLFNVKLAYNQLGQSDTLMVATFRQALFVKSDYLVLAGVDRQIGAHAAETVWQLSLRRYF